MVTRRVVCDVYGWMTEEGDPARWHHNAAARGDLIQVSAAEAERGESLGALADPDEVMFEDAPEVEMDDKTTVAEVRSETVTDDEGEPTKPPRAASKEAWVDYAVAYGADRAEAEDMTKADLIDTYS